MDAPTILDLAKQISQIVLVVGIIFLILRNSKKQTVNIAAFIIECLMYFIFAAAAPMAALTFVWINPEGAFTKFANLFFTLTNYSTVIYVIAGPALLWIGLKYNVLFIVCLALIFADFFVYRPDFEVIGYTGAFAAVTRLSFHSVSLSAGVVMFMKLVKLAISVLVDAVVRLFKGHPQRQIDTSRTEARVADDAKLRSGGISEDR